MITRLNSLDLTVVAGALLSGTLIALAGIKWTPSNLGGVAACIGAVLGPVATLYAIARNAEWKARAADPSTIVEQEKAAQPQG